MLFSSEPLGMCTDMLNIGIVPLLYEAPCDLSICVQGLRGHPYGNVSQQAAQIRIAVVQDYRLHQSSLLVVVYSHVHYWNCIPTVRGATGSINVCTKAVRAPIWRRKSERCIQPYSRYTKMRLASEYSALFGLLPCALAVSYTYRMKYHGISEFVSKGCAGTRTATLVSKLYRTLQRMYQNPI